MSDDKVFVLEKMKVRALMDLDERIEKHLKNEFYTKILPKAMKEVREKIIVDLVNQDDKLELIIKIKE